MKYSRIALLVGIVALAAVLSFGCSSPVVPRNALIKGAEIEVKTVWGSGMLKADEIDTRPVPRK